jgi:hypothetical protein
MATANIYCTSEDMADILSQAGVDLASSDYPPSDYGNAIAKAGNQIDFYLGRRYQPTSLAQSDLVKDWAAILACSFLRRRRGNPMPAGIASLVEEAKAQMEMVRRGQTEIPGIGVRKTSAPAMSVIRPTMRPFPRTVVEKSRGTTAGGKPEGYKQHTDPFDAAGGNAGLDFVI